MFGIFVDVQPPFISRKWLKLQGGGIKQIFAEGMPKICSGRYSVPTHQFFTINYLFFLSIFRTHQDFSKNANFFHQNLETYLHFFRKLTGTFFVDPLISRSVSEIGGVFSDIQFLTSF